MVNAKKYILAKQFDGEPKESDIKLVAEELPPLKDNEILCEAVYWSVDPYMRAYMPRYTAGTPMFGEQVANNVNYVGKYVVANFGWRTHTIANVTDPSLSSFYPFQVLPDLGKFPLSLALGALGMPGNTAYFGLKEICQPKAGEVVVVSGAAGAVGNHVGQIARILGISSSPDSTLYKIFTNSSSVRYFSFAMVSLTHKQQRDNEKDIRLHRSLEVGGTISSTVINHMRDFGRISVCGAISAYNAKKGELNTAPIVQPPIVMKQLKMEGFIVTRWSQRWQEGIKQNLKWIEEGKIKWRETVTEGFENMPKAFFGMLKGENFGKAVIKAKL
ncbi:hypothetical protein L9F63_005646 [Diploptera punctata]|uniref:15-oxoprostaglandin 13-reductase n=1 Tax=Diploptera punctata TaxID=6984 RepID=A0AAD7ZBR8_DIPPU|nr:hypothetical protein L9F63_005646 [Diploptera punctata]